MSTLEYILENLEPESYTTFAPFEIVEHHLNELEEEIRQRSIGQHHYGFWTMKNGQRIAYKDMTNTHLKNVIIMLKNVIIMLKRN